jgi:hypothetical protein
MTMDFIKLDIEGTELDALLGAGKMPSHFRPTIVAETKFGWELRRNPSTAPPQAMKVVHFTEIPSWLRRRLSGAARAGSRPAQPIARRVLGTFQNCNSFGESTIG